MTARRKTIAVDDIIDMVNTANKLGQLSSEHMQGHNALLNCILHATGNYNGFQYLAPYEVVRDGGDYDRQARRYYRSVPTVDGGNR